jgi:hypothetical protein
MKTKNTMESSDKEERKRHKEESSVIVTEVEIGAVGCRSSEEEKTDRDDCSSLREGQVGTEAQTGSNIRVVEVWRSWRSGGQEVRRSDLLARLTELN